MDRKKLFYWQLSGVFVIFLLAFLWHSLYELVPSPIIGAISPVNESPWEHAKLFFVPAILFYVIEYLFIGKDYDNFIFAHSIALLIMPIFMLLFYYGYKTILDIEGSLALDILNSFLTILLGSFVAYRLTLSDKPLYRYNWIAVLIVATLFVLYVTFTFNPPKYPVFYDRGQDQYGIRTVE